MQRKQVVVAALAAAILNVGLMAGAAFGGEKEKEKWKEKHPRRHEVNHRLHDQNERIKEGLKSGKLTPQQAKALHKEDHQIREEDARTRPRTAVTLPLPRSSSSISKKMPRATRSSKRSILTSSWILAPRFANRPPPVSGYPD